jgi:hypothetical protein
VDILASWADASPSDTKGLLDECICMAIMVYKVKGELKGFSNCQLHIYLSFSRKPKKN